MSNWLASQIPQTHRNNQRGQALVEGMISMVVLAILCAGAIEVARVWAFKGMLKTAAQEVAVQLSHNTLLLLREGELDFDTQHSDVSKHYEQIIKQQMASYLGQLPTVVDRSSLSTTPLSSLALRSYIVADRDTAVEATQPNKLGIRGFYVSVNACLPLFFGEQVAHAEPNRNNPSFDKRDCLGQYSASARPFVLSVHVMAYAPVPASVQIFRHGLPEPEELKGVSPTVSDVLGAERGKTHNSFQRASDSFRKGIYPVDLLLNQDNRHE